MNDYDQTIKLNLHEAAVIPYEEQLKEIFYEKEDVKAALPWKILSFYRIPGEVTVKKVALHWHPFVEIIYALEQDADCMINGEPYLLKEGDIVIINANDIHASKMHDPEQGYRGYSVKISSIYLNSRIKDFGSIRFALDPERKHIVIDLLQKMIASRALKDTGRNLRTQMYMDQMLSELLEYHSVRKEEGGYDEADDALRLCISYLNDHYTEDIDLTEMSEALHLSYAYIARVMKKKLGRTIHEYLSELRCERAIKLMSGKETMEEIALHSGFPNLRSFNTAFRRIYGQLPKEYKKSRKL